MAATSPRNARAEAGSSCRASWGTASFIAKPCWRVVAVSGTTWSLNIRPLKSAPLMNSLHGPPQRSAPTREVAATADERRYRAAPSRTAARGAGGAVREKAALIPNGRSFASRWTQQTKMVLKIFSGTHLLTVPGLHPNRCCVRRLTLERDVNRSLQTALWVRAWSQHFPIHSTLSSICKENLKRVYPVTGFRI